MNNLLGKIALVTGSAKNLGRTIAIDLARQGVKVAVHYNTSENEAKKTLEEVKKYSDGIIIHADLTNPKDVTSMFNSINKKLGKIDILINLVGDFIYQSIKSVQFDQFRNVIESNLYSTFLCCKEVLPGMLEKKWGRIINFGNTGAENIMIREKTTPYFIAKTGVVMLTKVLAYEYASSGITVNSISPGILTTSIVKTATPAKRFAKFTDIINAVNFLLKEESSYINGANIEVAGSFIGGFS